MKLYEQAPYILIAAEGKKEQFSLCLITATGHRMGMDTVELG
jgi:hypothetical protein